MLKWDVLDIFYQTKCHRIWIEHCFEWLACRKASIEPFSCFVSATEILKDICETAELLKAYSKDWQH